MSIPYQNIAKAVAVRAKQVSGGDSASISALINAASISAGMDGVDVVYPSLKLDILAVEKELAELIGRDTNSIYRAKLAIVSANIANGASVPTVSSVGIPFVGHFDGIFDSVDSRVLTEDSYQYVQRRIENAGGFFKLPAYKFHLQGTRIFHTRPNVVFRGCGWDYATQSTAFDSPTGVSPLPANLESLWICKVLGKLPQENWFINEGQYYAQMAAQMQADLISGRIASMTLPSMTATTSKPNPILN